MTNKHVRGSREFYQNAYANAMTILRVLHCKIDLLITFTMDPDCDEVLALLPEGQHWYDRPDIVCRIFVDKLKELKEDLTGRNVMGPIIAWFYSLEFQRR